MKKIGICAAIFIFFLILPVFVLYSRGDTFRVPPAPQLLSPPGEEVILTGKDSLQFKWSADFSIWVDHYEFKLYKGYEAYTENLLLKESLSSGENFLKVKAELFENGQVYTWSLRGISDSGMRGETSFNSFHIVK
jgi:hypothetical protein